MLRENSSIIIRTDKDWRKFSAPLESTQYHIAKTQRVTPTEECKE
jgi:hypothetical protein